MTTDTKRKPQDKIAEPPKKWRNWYKCHKTFARIDTNQVHTPGDVLCGSKLWPSKDAAETAVRNVPFSRSIVANGFAEYLGAEPEQ